MIKRYIQSLIVAMLCIVTAYASADVAIPPLKSRVTDLTQTFSREETTRLEQRLADFETKKGSQIAVLIVPTTQPETIEQYSIRVVEAWKLGRQGIDDGVLLLIAKNDRTLRIETGYGLEGVLPDALARRIIDEVIVPQLKHGDFFGGVQAGIEQIFKVIEGEPLPPPLSGKKSAGPDIVLENFIPILLIFLVLGKMLQTMFGRMIGATVTGTIAGSIIWLIFSSLAVAALVAIAVFAISLFEQTGNIVHRGGHRGRYKGWPDSGGFGGGFRGGGFGGGFGGGGGGFGGGGASGRW